MVRTLAEPTLTAISGESAHFLAGGEFPVPTGRDKDGVITITYKPFGVGLSFTPVVLTEDRISLHVKTEVSDLSTENAFQASGLDAPGAVRPPQRIDPRASLRRIHGHGRAAAGQHPPDASAAFPPCRSCPCSAPCSAAATSSGTRPSS